ncbi:sensor histidine kinase [Vibrio sp. OPT46]|uniref:sensor histidine kinase n=1 Tax=Vibrio sp. OPT46 TaxID=2778645 RepID=UPI001880A8E9|nr:ATP-binding protein [Vibrio sp. OPT46]MBE8570470.1 ATP-binding protein [Vibrio sp. OPT46]
MTLKTNYRSDTLNFEVDAQLIRELGERLVSRNHIGISELIKNSYDADSPLVEVILSNVTNHDLRTSELTIVDSGSGMSFETVKNRWMIIGTSNKRENPISPIFGRPVTGNKGIGRFACQRLAERLELETCSKTDDGYEYTKVQFEWDDFEPGVSLSKVNCEYETYTDKMGKAGTTLRLKGLREHITERDFKMILKSISLISIAEQTRRDGYPEDPGFDATVTAPEFSALMGGSSFKVDDKLLTAGWGTIIGKIDPEGNVSFTLDSKDTETQTYLVQNKKYPPLGDITFIIHIIPLKIRDGIENRRNPTLLTGGPLKQIHSQYSGIKLYLNGFRVYPYGEVAEGDDWLKISHDLSRRRGPSDYPELQDVAKQMGIASPSRVMLNHPGTRSLVGNVVIKGQAVNSFEVKMDREGLVSNDNFSNLKKIIRMSLDWATINYEAWLIKERKKKHDKVKKRFEDSVGSTFEDDKSRFTKAIETLTSGAQQTEAKDNSDNDNSEEQNGLDNSNSSSSKQSLKPSFKESSLFTSTIQNKDNNTEENTTSVSETSREQLDTAKAYALSQYEALEAETELLRAVSATAPLLFVFAHEVKGIVQTLSTQSKRLEYIASKIQDPSITQELTSMAKSADLYQESFNNLFGLFDVFSESSENAKKKISYVNLFNSVQTGFKFFIQQFGIELSFDNVNPTVRVAKLNQAEAYSVLINLLSNSIKSLIASSTKDRKIHVSVHRNDGEHTILVKDNGIGLSEEHWDKVFEARTYDPEGKLYSSVSSKLGDEKLSNLGKGSGLGLNIVRNILRKHKGDVAFIQPSTGWNAEIKVNIGS